LKILFSTKKGGQETIKLSKFEPLAVLLAKQTGLAVALTWGSYSSVAPNTDTTALSGSFGYPSFKIRDAGPIRLLEQFSKFKNSKIRKKSKIIRS
jgi:hypothetical protein